MQATPKHAETLAYFFKLLRRACSSEVVDWTRAELETLLGWTESMSKLSFANASSLSVLNRAATSAGSYGGPAPPCEPLQLQEMRTRALACLLQNPLRLPKDLLLAIADPSTTLQVCAAAVPELVRCNLKLLRSVQSLQRTTRSAGGTLHLSQQSLAIGAFIRMVAETSRSYRGSRVCRQKVPACAAAIGKCLNAAFALERGTQRDRRPYATVQVAIMILRASAEPWNPAVAGTSLAQASLPAAYLLSLDTAATGDQEDVPADAGRAVVATVAASTDSLSAGTVVAAWSALSSGSTVCPASAPSLAQSWLAVDRSRRFVLRAAEYAARREPGHEAQPEAGQAKSMDSVAWAKPSTGASDGPLDPHASGRGPPVDKVEASLDTLMHWLIERGNDAPWPVGRGRDRVASRLLELAAALGAGAGAGDGARVQGGGAGAGCEKTPAGTEPFGASKGGETGREEEEEEEEEEESSAAVDPDGPVSVQQSSGASAGAPLPRSARPVSVQQSSGASAGAPLPRSARPVSVQQSSGASAGAPLPRSARPVSVQQSSGASAGAPRPRSAWPAKGRMRAAGTGGSLAADAAHILSSSSSSSDSSGSNSGSDDGVES